MNSNKIRRKTDYPPLASTRLLDQLRERIRYKHYSLSTERTYVQWVRTFVHFHTLRHPREMGKPEVEAFLTWLATERRVSASTHRQALSAWLFRLKVRRGHAIPSTPNPHPAPRLRMNSSVTAAVASGSAAAAW